MPQTQYSKVVQQFEQAYDEVVNQAKLAHGIAGDATTRTRMALNGAAEIYNTLTRVRDVPQDTARKLKNIARKCIIGIPIYLDIPRDDPVIKKAFGVDHFRSYHFRFMQYDPSMFEGDIKDLEKRLKKDKDKELVLEEAEILEWEISRYNLGKLDVENEKKAKDNEAAIETIIGKAQSKVWYGYPIEYDASVVATKEIEEKVLAEEKKGRVKLFGPRGLPNPFYVFSSTKPGVGDDATVYAYFDRAAPTDISTGKKLSETNLYLVEIRDPHFFNDPILYATYLRSIIEISRQRYSNLTQFSLGKRDLNFRYLARSTHKMINRTLCEMGGKPLQKIQDGIIYEIPFRQPSGRVRVIKLNGTEFTNGPIGNQNRKKKGKKKQKKRAKRR